ncbi:MAG: acyl carrier protein [Nitrospirales bacterium]
MSEASPVYSQIARLFEEKLHLEIPSTETDLFKTGALDSMAFVDLLVHLEQEFGVAISFEELELDHFRSITKIAEFVTARNGKETPKPM